MTKTRKRNAKQEAQRILAEHSVRSAPVGVERIARALGASLEVRPLDEQLSGMIFIKAGVPVIGVNALHHPHRQRFTIGHEVGHLVLHRDRLEGVVHVDKTYPMLRRDQASSTGVDLMEIEANAFAAELLMPEALLEGELTTPLDVDDEERLTALSRKFKVSTSAMRYRLIGYFFE
ncbi:MAG: ImmA/IrrE family metallo-endopeptidase [Hyphomicrobiaceae bacterium]|nr:ImmA/IrrE family metallo-endopeptidase [Hyphomicrobiaceae bacterium]